MQVFRCTPSAEQCTLERRHASQWSYTISERGAGVMPQRGADKVKQTANSKGYSTPVLVRSNVPEDTCHSMHERTILLIPLNIKMSVSGRDKLQPESCHGPKLNIHANSHIFRDCIRCCTLTSGGSGSGRTLMHTSCGKDEASSIQNPSQYQLPADEITVVFCDRHLHCAEMLPSVPQANGRATRTRALRRDCQWIWHPCRRTHARACCSGRMSWSTCSR